MSKNEISTESQAIVSKLVVNDKFKALLGLYIDTQMDTETFVSILERIVEETNYSLWTINPPGVA